MCRIDACPLGSGCRCSFLQALSRWHHPACPLQVADDPRSGYPRGDLCRRLPSGVTLERNKADERAKELTEVIKLNTAAMTTMAEVDRNNTAVLVEVKDAIIKCRNKDEYHDVWNGKDERRKP